MTFKILAQLEIYSELISNKKIWGFDCWWVWFLLLVSIYCLETWLVNVTASKRLLVTVSKLKQNYKDGDSL